MTITIDPGVRPAPLTDAERIAALERQVADLKAQLQQTKTRDDIIRMARESGFEILIVDGVEELGCGDGYHIQTDLIERFAYQQALEAFRARSET